MPRSPKTEEAPRQETRDALVATAERLFAEHGLDAVSMRRINREAGQLNTSSIHYYFGSREAVVEAVVERRMSGVNQRRLAMIEQTKGQPIELADIVACYVRPLADVGAGDGGAYVRFLAQAYASAEVQIADVARGKWDQSLDSVRSLARARLPDLSEAVFRGRMLNLFRGVVYALADWQRDKAAGRLRSGSLSYDAFVEDLIAVHAAGLGAPAMDLAAAEQ